MKLQALELLYYEKRFSDKIMFNIECCVPLNFVCVEKKIYWFLFIYTMVNCTVWLECCTCDIHTLPSGLMYSAVGYGNV